MLSLRIFVLTHSVTEGLAMNQELILRRISILLARFQEEVRIVNPNGEFSINIHAENVLLKILNIAYGLDLVNVNYVEGKTFSAIDLKDEERKTAFQISSSGTVNKVVHTLQKFSKNDLDKKYAHLYFYFLKGMDKNVRTGNQRIAKEIGSLENVDLVFLDHTQFYLYLNKMNDLDRLIRICNLLEVQFGDVALSEGQFSGFNGRNANKNLNVSEKKHFTNKDIITPFTKTASNSAQGGTYVPRFDLLEKLDKCFSLHRIIFLSGVGGCGKSELARAYAEMHYAKYDEIFWLTCTEGVVPDLMTLISEAEPDLINKPEKPELKELTYKDLIIVDNCNADEPRFLNELENWTGSAHILVTTRLSRVGNYGLDLFIPVESNDPKDFAFKVFKSNYCKKPRWSTPREIRSDEKQPIHEICRSVQYNTMIVSLIAIYLRDHNSLSISECAKLVRKGVGVLDGSIRYSKDQYIKSQDMKTILQHVFADILHYDFYEAQKEVLILLSLAPASWFEMNYIYALLDGPSGRVEHKVPTEELLDRGCLQCDGKRVSLHPLIHEVISNQKILTRDSSYFEKLLINYLGVSRDYLLKEKYLVNKILNCAVSALPEYKIATMLFLNHPDYKTFFIKKYPEVAVAFFVCVNHNGQRHLLFRDIIKEETCSLVTVPCRLNEKKHAILLKVFNTGVPYKLTFDLSFYGQEIEEIPDRAFCFDQYLFSCTFSPKTKRIGKESFYQSGLIEELKLPESLVSIGDFAFSECNRLTGSLKLPERLVSISDYAFSGCSSLIGELKLPKGLTSIGEGAFTDCNGLTGELRLPEKLNSIGAGAFANCSKLTGELKLPKALTFIGVGAFANCNRLTGTISLMKELASKGAFKSFFRRGADVQSSFPNIMSRLDDPTYTGSSKLTGILRLRKDLTSISDFKFYGCSGLTGELILPEKLTYIGDFAFLGCSGLTGELRLPENLTYIGLGAFSGCSGLTGELKLPEKLTYLGGNAFANCEGLTGGLRIPEKLTRIGVNTFFGCSRLNGKLTLPGGLSIIGDNAFFGCGRLKGEINFPKKLTHIGNGAFFCCDGLTGSLSLPVGLTYIGTHAFYGCSGLNGTLSLPSNLKFIGARAFCGCSKLTGELKLPYGLTYIGDSAFFGCNGITGELTIQEHLSYLGYHAFWGCNKIEKITFLNPHTQINESVSLNASIVICGYKNSTAEIYAKNRCMVFEEIE